MHTTMHTCNTTVFILFGLQHIQESSPKTTQSVLPHYTFAILSSGCMRAQVCPNHHSSLQKFFAAGTYIHQSTFNECVSLKIHDYQSWCITYLQFYSLEFIQHADFIKRCYERQNYYYLLLFYNFILSCEWDLKDAAVAFFAVMGTS